MKIKHILSVEISAFKRQFILAAHQAAADPDFHLFKDVNAFLSEKGEAHCFVCDKVHALPTHLDLLFSGPSCKNLSKEFKDKKSYTDCGLADT